MGVFTYTSKKTGNTYYLNEREWRNSTYFYFAKTIRNGVPELPEGFAIIEVSNGVPMLIRK